MKKIVIELEWGFMSNSQRFPVLKSGKILSVTAYDRGQGQWGGRFPVGYAVCTEGTVIENITVHNSKPKPDGRVWHKDTKAVIFRDYDRAKKVAQEWASK